MRVNEIEVESECKNCNHDIRLHTPTCTEKYHDGGGRGEKRICNCNIPEYYNTQISAKYMGWTELHCNNCGKLLCYVNSIDEHELMYDVILCSNCIKKNKIDKK